MHFKIGERVKIDRSYWFPLGTKPEDTYFILSYVGNETYAVVNERTYKQQTYHFSWFIKIINYLDVNSLKENITSILER